VSRPVHIYAGLPLVHWRPSVTVRVRAANPPERPLFVGIARSADVESFLKGTAYDEVRASSSTVESITHHIGALASTPVISPGEQSIWAAASVGSGTRDMVWRAHDGQWLTVIMNADEAHAGQRDPNYEKRKHDSNREPSEHPKLLPST